jgi:hypothetical protein
MAALSTEILPEERAVVAQARCLEDHFVGPLIAAQAETRRKVCLEILDLPDIRHNSLVDLLLILYPLGVRLLLLCWLAILEELLLALAILLLPSPVLVLADPVYHLLVHAGDVYSRRGPDYITVVDAADGHTVGLVGAGDEEDTLRELAKENDALAAETSREENENISGCE